MENLCSSFFSFTSLAGVGEGVIKATLSSPCPSPRHANISCGSPPPPPFVSPTLRDSLIEEWLKRLALGNLLTRNFKKRLINPVWIVNTRRCTGPVPIATVFELILWSCKILHKWIPKAVQLKRIPLHKECKGEEFYSTKEVWWWNCSSDIIAHKGHWDRFGCDDCSTSCQFGEQLCAMVMCHTVLSY